MTDKLKPTMKKAAFNWEGGDAELTLTIDTYDSLDYDLKDKAELLAELFKKPIRVVVSETYIVQPEKAPKGEG